MILCACGTNVVKQGKCPRCGATVFDKTKDEVMREMNSKQFRDNVSRAVLEFNRRKT